MKASRIGLVALAVLVAALRSPEDGAQSPALFSDKELARIFKHSPLEGPPPDPTNRWADDERAARLGQRLFFEKRFSKNGAIACATCHDPAKALTDGRSLAQGLASTDRHAPSLWNVAWQRWYFWDGRADSLWSQALKPLEHPSEMGASRTDVARTLAGDAGLRGEYEAIFGALPDLSDRARFPIGATPARGADTPEATRWRAMSAQDQQSVDRVFANVGKSLEAFERKLVSRDSAFDRFVAALRAGDVAAQQRYPEAARRGLALFVGKANCRSCHAGPAFTDQEFHNIGVPTLDKSPPRDAGRLAGLAQLRADEFNAAAVYSDDRTGERARDIAQISDTPENWGRFKTPSLRNVAVTAPYMHQGQFATLRDILHYYSTLEGTVPAGHHGEQVIKPLELAPQEIDDILAFLDTLTDTNLPAALLAPPAPTADASGSKRGGQ